MINQEMQMNDKCKWGMIYLWVESLLVEFAMGGIFVGGIYIAPHMYVADIVFNYKFTFGSRYLVCYGFMGIS